MFQECRWEQRRVALQVCGETHLGQPVLGLRAAALLLLAFEVEPVELGGDGRQGLAFGLRQEQSHVEGRRQADGGEGHEAELTQLPLEPRGAETPKGRYDTKQAGRRQTSGWPQFGAVYLSA